LPTIVCFIDGIAVDRLVGFSDLGNKDDFPTLMLVRRLIKAGVLVGKTKAEKGQIKIKKKHDSDSGDDDY
jgi:hypothetical protein